MEYKALIHALEHKLNVEKSFDLQIRPVVTPFGEASVFTAAGLCSGELAHRVIEYLLRCPDG